MAGSNNFFRSDLFSIYNVVQASMISYPKEAIIATLRDYFSHDSFYSFKVDSFGHPNVTDHTDLPLGADMPYGPGARPQLNTSPILPTRLFIGENYPYNGIFYPAILVKNGGSKYVQISFNRNQGEIEYEARLFVDGYGHQTVINVPIAFVTTGAWEGQVIIDILTRSLDTRDELLQYVAMLFTDIQFDTLHQMGIVVKPLTIGSPSESDDRNDKLFKQSITLDIRSEWKRCIPIRDTIDAILFTATFGDLSTPGSQNAPDLTITECMTIADTLINR